MEIPKFIKGVAKYFTYASDSGETTPTTQADLQELMKNNNTILECLVDGLWQAEKEMKLNQIIRSPNMPANTVAKVTSVGVTGTTEPEWPETVEATVSDGSVTFKMVENITNTFRSNLAVSNGTTAGSQGQIVLGVKPSTATVQANIIASTTGALNYIATENAGHYFRIGNNTASTSITTNESETAILSHNAFEFARITNVGVAKWLGNANTATKLETSRTINGVAFDGTKDIIVDSNPVGTIIAVAYTGVPEGYMHCNGAAVNRTTYVNLFNKIGTTYGAGDGSTTFNLPNTVARFLEGGIDAGTYYEAGLPNITGNISAFKSSISGAFVGSNNTSRYDGWNDNEDEYAVSTSFDASRSNSIYGASTTVQPPAMTVIYCIKY